MIKKLYQTAGTSRRNRFFWVTLQVDPKLAGFGVSWHYDPDEYALTHCLCLRVACFAILEFAIQWGRET